MSSLGLVLVVVLTCAVPQLRTQRVQPRAQLRHTRLSQAAYALRCLDRLSAILLLYRRSCALQRRRCTLRPLLCPERQLSTKLFYSAIPTNISAPRPSPTANRHCGWERPHAPMDWFSWSFGGWCAGCGVTLEVGCEVILPGTQRHGDPRILPCWGQMQAYHCVSPQGA